MPKKNTNFDTYLSSIMSEEMSDLFKSEIIKSLNNITFKGKRKITGVRLYGNSIAITLEAYNKIPMETYSFGLVSKLSSVILL